MLRRLDFANLKLELRNSKPVHEHVAEFHVFLRDLVSQFLPSWLRKHYIDEEIAIMAKKEWESLVDLKNELVLACQINFRCDFLSVALSVPTPQELFDKVLDLAAALGLFSLVLL